MVVGWKLEIMRDKIVLLMCTIFRNIFINDYITVGSWSLNKKVLVDLRFVYFELT